MPAAPGTVPTRQPGVPTELPAESKGREGIGGSPSRPAQHDRIDNEERAKEKPGREDRCMSWRAALAAYERNE
jgi:hypothetical protein